MKNDFTPFIPAMNLPCNTNRCKSDSSERRPRRSTLQFIRQFAHAYTSVPTLPVSLGAFIAN
ncbi:MAG: hypothetical protein ACI30D_08405 [Muribaculaceae bacterium]|nr:hypothetical protein [Muribaculaceae bacterium]